MRYILLYVMLKTPGSVELNAAVIGWKPIQMQLDTSNEKRLQPWLKKVSLIKTFSGSTFEK